MFTLLFLKKKLTYILKPYKLLFNIKTHYPTNHSVVSRTSRIKHIQGVVMW